MANIVKKYLLLILLVVIILPQTSIAQKKSKIDIKNSNTFRIERDIHPDITKFIGDVFLTHGNIKMYCDSAYNHEKDNEIEAFGNVHIINADTIHIYGDYLKYEGDSRRAALKNNITLKNKNVSLTTNKLDYDMDLNVGYYDQGGTIVDSTNVLTSIIGRYYTKQNLFFFKDSVVLENKDYTLYSDTLQYHTVSKIINILGPTRIENEKETLYSELGWYNTLTGISHLLKNNKVNRDNYQITGDSIHLDKQKELALIYRNVELQDTLNNLIARGHYLEMHKDTEKAFLTDSTLFIQINAQDSLFLHSDTLKIEKDTNNFNRISAYNKVKFFRKDLQGKCDSISYSLQDSTMRMFHDPIVWAQGNQITADTISIESQNNAVKYLHFRTNAFLCSREDSTLYNQIKGRNMLGHVNKNHLDTLDIIGNGETLYFPRDEHGIIIGMNVAKSSSISISIIGQKIDQILFTKKPDGNMYPLFDIVNQKRLLKDFEWRDNLRPKTKDEIFIWKASATKPQEGLKKRIEKAITKELEK
ncbi:OstA-like protein [Ancylomarina sp. 16SWW S1-10-2]|uniref:OstA-like protein n=1 Tax=Ancylomarina sp. 16SWW S1-10-2 TaxID=2499681 RepID=UPI0012AE86D4|nr:OstA-like protein [Ancylomarina sp. 16SWW S1-10-2]MRT93156.1 organic solvent tolerance protein OstA [Ancylomarina sp. 16SWW S1-10-2]